ncbi:response regulator [Marinivivus vitaminiproducens]|uniref:response regulator n=1 Tax=Marinivivus vitaminiproducens TaxID=3035935 RepID=UPI0027AB6B4D|nr:response regulator [Geminicoccaceae bacterium SCSIO 64248]
MDGSHILVVDDHRDIRDPLAVYLKRHGFRTTTAQSAAAARDVLNKASIDLVVLDIMMPGEDGLSLCRHLQERGPLPVILLTAMTELADRVAGLEIGADDYVIKPFEPRELVARIRTVLRRASRVPKPLGEERRRIAFDSWLFDVEKRELIGEDGVSIPLSTGEFRLLQVLTQRPNLVLTRDQLIDLTSGRSAQVFDRSIDNQVSRLRKKIEPDPRNPRLIKTVWGDGYVFACEPRVVE